MTPILTLLPDSMGCFNPILNGEFLIASLRRDPISSKVVVVVVIVLVLVVLVGSKQNKTSNTSLH